MCEKGHMMPLFVFYKKEKIGVYRNKNIKSFINIFLQMPIF